VGPDIKEASNIYEQKAVEFIRAELAKAAPTDRRRIMKNLYSLLSGVYLG
jgi:hypothetical protein